MNGPSLASFSLGLLALGCSTPRPAPVAPLSLEAPAARTPASTDRVQATEPQAETKRKMEVSAGIGALFDPDAFLIGGALDIPVAKDFTVGPMVQIGLDNDVDLFAIEGQVKYWLPVNDLDLPIEPYLQGGLGAVYMDKDRRPSDDGFTFHAGAGLRIIPNETITLGSLALVHFMPGEVADEDTYFSWEIVQIVFKF